MGGPDEVDTGPPDQSQRRRHAARSAGPSPAAGASPLARSRWVATSSGRGVPPGRVPADDRRDVSRRVPTVRRRPPRLKGGLCTGMRHEVPPEELSAVLSSSMAADMGMWTEADTNPDADGHEI